MSCSTTRTSANVVLAALVALVLGLPLVLWWRTSDSTAHATERADAQRALASAASAVAALVEAAPPVDPARDASERAARAAVENAAEAAVDATASGHAARRSSGLRVIVLHRDTREPLANVDVWHYDTWEHAAADLERAPYDEPDPRERYAKLGARETSDARGELYLPRPRGRLLALVHANGLYGQAEWRASSEEPAYLIAQPAHALEIAVKSADGTYAADVPVALRARLGDDSRVLWEGRTAARDGAAPFARIAALEPLLERVEGWEICASIASPSSLAPERRALARGEQRIDARAPQTRVELALPPCGSVRVRLLDDKGAPLHTRGVANIALDPKTSNAPAFAANAAPPDRSSYARVFDDGEFVITHVALGERVSVRVRSDGWPRQTLPALDGPRKDGEQVLLEYRFQKRAPLLVGRVVDATGAPQAERMFQGSVRWPAEPSKSARRLDGAITTDAEGRFRYAPRSGLATGVRDLELVEVSGASRTPLADSAVPIDAATGAGADAGAAASDAAAAASASTHAAAAHATSDALVAATSTASSAHAADCACDAPVRRSGRAALPAPIGNEDVDVGDVVLSSERASVIGSVVDAGGRAVPGALVRIERAQTDADGSLEYRGVVDEPIVSDEHGCWAAYKLRESAGALWACAQKDGYLDGERIALGAGSVRLALASGGALEGRVLLSTDVARERLSLLVRESRGRSEEPDEQELELDANGRFRASGLRPGTWDFELAIEGSLEPLFTASGLAIEGGATNRDERLQAIDLRALVRGYTITVRGPDDRPIDDGRVAVLRLADGEQAWSTKVDLHAGRARVAGAGPSIDLEISARGYRPLRLLGVREDRDVRLEPGLRVRVRFEPASADSAAPRKRYVFVEARHDGGDDERKRPAWSEDSVWQELDERGEASLVLPLPGSYAALVWSEEQESGNRQWTSSGPAGPGSPWIVSIDERAGEQLVLLRAQAAAARGAASADSGEQP